MSDNLGEKVSITSDDLPYPGSAPPDDLFDSAQEAEAPFSMDAPPAKLNRSDSLEVAYEPKVKKAVAAKPEPKAQPKSSVPTKKPSLQLQKFREAFSLQRIKKVPHTVVRNDGEGGSVSMTFQLRAMNYEDFQWVAMRATELKDMPIAFAWNLTSTAISICAMDMELEENAQPTPIHEVFDIKVEGATQVRDPYYPAPAIRFAAADALLLELKSSLYDVVEELHQAVDNTISSQSQLIEQEKDENPLV
jgi:hypothetical protein